MNVGHLIEGLICYDWPEGRTLTPQVRESIVQFACGFEECQEPTEKLAAMGDKDLVQYAYRVMAEYASGQV